MRYVIIAALLFAGCQQENAVQTMARFNQERKAQAESAPITSAIIGIPSFEYSYNTSFSPYLIVEASVKNISGEALGYVAGDLMLKDESRSLPYVELGFVEKIPGGIEPGETMDLTFASNSFDREVMEDDKTIKYPKAKWFIRLGNGDLVEFSPPPKPKKFNRPARVDFLNHDPFANGSAPFKGKSIEEASGGKVTVGSDGTMNLKTR